MITTRRFPGLWAAQVAAGLALILPLVAYASAVTVQDMPLLLGPFAYGALPVLCVPPLLANGAVSLRRLCLYTCFVLPMAGLLLGPNVLPSWIFMGIGATLGYVRRG